MMPKNAHNANKPAADAPAHLVDEQLARYRAMRDFAMTAEPSGESSAKKKKKKTGTGLPFVVQKHAATRLHYDFRLGWKGVLKSWAVTKGPSYVVADKRLAVEVEDHPMEYGGFEGTIPKGQYGGGTVMVWDTGTWEPVTDVDEGLRKGQLKFILHGKKLHGHWALVRMKGNRFGDKGKNNWLLIKEHDEFERTADDPAITDEAPDSAITGRSIEQIAAAGDHVWNSHIPEKKAPANRSLLTRRSVAAKPAEQPVPGLVKKTPSSGRPVPDRDSILRDTPREKMPGFLSPELASSVDQPPQGDEWLHELKLDGYRIQIHIERDGRRRVHLFTRRGLDWTHRMRDLAATAVELPVHAAILDGEVVVLNEKGLTSFGDLQAAFEQGAAHPLTYYAFDLLHLDGHNLRNLPLERRKSILEGLLHEHGEDGLRYCSHIRGNGDDMFRRACQMGAEGIVSKLATAAWRGERSRLWLKSKCVLQQEFVVGGFAPLSTGSHGIGALLLGYYNDGDLIYAGRTGSGFNQQTHTVLRDRLDALRQAKSPFHSVPAEAKKDAIWVSPSLVVEVRFAAWTNDDLVRQAAYLGLREDKQAKEVVRETMEAVPRSARKHTRGAARPEPHGARTAKVAAPSTTAAKVEARTTPKSHSGRAVVAGVSISHPDKILDAPSHLTKLQLVEYYDAIADHLLPHIAERPLSIVRCPDGAGQPCFFQKQIGKGMPAGIDSVPVTVKKGGRPQREEYVTVSTREGLVGLGQMGVMELHPWGSSNRNLEQPDRLIIDLDPDPDLPWKQLVASAVEIRDLMKHLGLETFVKSTGGKGIHVVAPLAPRHEWPTIKEFAHHFVLMMERANPKLYLTKMTKSARTGRIFLDYLRNERGATAVAPYSPRARAGVRVAMPLTWNELEKTDPKQFAVANFGEWKGRLKRDPWLAMNQVRQQLSERAVAAVAEMAGKKL
ncbi:MAG TPA: DNA ligase D [Acidobacteriaceae bacterium]|nr:DNA ligase D [Acidobacteriaceae bacterium]